MAYHKQGFSDGNTLYAKHLIAMEEAIIELEDKVKNSSGAAIDSIVRTDGDGSPGTYDTYTITMTDGRTSTFTVYNGKDAPSAHGYLIEFGTLEYNSDGTVESTLNFSQSYHNEPMFIPYVENEHLRVKVEALSSPIGYYGGKVTVTNNSGESIAATVSVSAYCSLPTGTM